MFSDNQDYLSQYYGMLSKTNPRDLYTPGYNYYNGLYRLKRSQGSRLNGGFYPRDARHLKRSHRTKRDLYLPEYLQQNLPYDESYLNRPYTNYPSDDDELSYLLDALDKYEGDDGEDDVMDYVKYDNNYLPYDGYEVENDDEYLPWYEAPAKRQTGLGFVPGIKRSRDFYPAFLEPGTHFQAFVPQKRSLEEYADAYEKVMELAAALRRQNYYPEVYGYEV